jgi:hypothetical protein
MGAKEVYDMDEHKDIFHLVRWDCFRDNFCKLKMGGFQKPNSRGGRNANPLYVAKPILHKYIINNMITDEMDVKAVHAMDEFKEIDFERFKDNFKRLKKRIRNNQGHAETDLAGYKKDTQTHKLAKDIKTDWHGSKAETILKEDVEKMQHKEVKLKEIYMGCNEYKKFSFKVFRGHVYQEVRSKTESAYWLVKKKKKEKQKRARLEEQKYREDDNDFYDPVLQFDSLENWS